VDDPQYRLTISGSQKPYLSGRLSADRNILPVYRPLVNILEVESAMVVPLIVRDRSLGELMLGSRRAEFFNNYDLQIVSTAAGQLASAIENASRSTQTDESLHRRVEQLTSIARVSRELNSMIDLKSLLEVVRDESLRTTRAECGAILLFNTTVSSNPPPVILALGCDLPETFSALDQKAIESGEAQLVIDYSMNDETPFHEGVRSALIVPIIAGGKTLDWYTIWRLAFLISTAKYTDSGFAGGCRAWQCSTLSGAAPAHRSVTPPGRNADQINGNKFCS
jgi:GAF domain-containing protein